MILACRMLLCIHSCTKLVSFGVHQLFDTRNEGSASFFFFILAASILLSETAVIAKPFPEPFIHLIPFETGLCQFIGFIKKFFF